MVYRVVKSEKKYKNSHKHLTGGVVAYWLGRQTCDQQVVSLTPGRALLG